MIVSIHARGETKNMKASTSILLALTAAVSLLLAPAYGQTITGRIVGTVTDQAKAAVPDANVTITNRDTGVAWRIKTDARGDYIAPSLPAGNYKIQVEL